MNDNLTISAFEFFQIFPDAESARLHLEQRRWNGHVVCPYCGSERVSARTGKRVGYYQCGGCKKEFTVRTKTVFERSHVPLNKWLFVVYLVVTARKGISSLQLSKEIGVTQKTAWFMLQRLREACGPNGDKLRGIIEVDETYIGGKEKNKHADKKLKAGRGPVGKQAVVGLRERGGNVKAMPIQSTDKETLHGVIHDNVAQGSKVCTDEHKGYVGLIGFDHAHVKHSAGEYVGAKDIHVNGVESVWAVLKRGLYGVWHHASRKHLHRYVNEASFRLNEGNCKVHTMDRINAFLSKAFAHRSITYGEVIA